jgi:hypothetical protein
MSHKGFPGKRVLCHLAGIIMIKGVVTMSAPPHLRD